MTEFEKCFQENFSSRGELGAGVSVWKDGQEVVSLVGGFRERERRGEWRRDTLVPVYSATKGPAAATLLHVLGKRGLDAECPVNEVWKGFPVRGATFGEMLSHQCGLAALGEVADVFDHRGWWRRWRERSRSGAPARGTATTREPSVSCWTSA